MLVDGRESFLSYRRFPWFLGASIQSVLNVRRPTRLHLHWPDLDVDLDLRSLEKPAQYPLVSRCTGSRDGMVRERPGKASVRSRSAAPAPRKVRGK